MPNDLTEVPTSELATGVRGVLERAPRMLRWVHARIEGELASRVEADDGFIEDDD